MKACQREGRDLDILRFRNARTGRPQSAWLIKYHPELSTVQITKLIGTTKPTIESIRNRTHWNISGLQPTDPVTLGLCKQTELDEAVEIAARKKAKELAAKDSPVGKSLLETKESLKKEPDSKLPPKLSDLATFTLTSLEKDRAARELISCAHSWIGSGANISEFGRRLTPLPRYRVRYSDVFR